MKRYIVPAWLSVVLRWLLHVGLGKIASLIVVCAYKLGFIIDRHAR